MPETVYILCGLTSIACAVLLVRQYLATHARLLFWSAGCFICFAATNVLLFVDLILVPDVDLSPVRSLVTLLGIVMLLSALIWESR